jgi:hypothetical protein
MRWSHQRALTSLQNKTPAMQYVMYKSQCFKYRQREAKRYADESMQIGSCQNSGNGIAWTWCLRLAFRNVLFLRWTSNRLLCGYKDGTASDWIRAVVGYKDGLAPLVTRSVRSFVRDEDRLAACKLGACTVVAVRIRSAPERQLRWGSLAIIGHVDGATTRSQEWAGVVEIVEWCSSTAIVRLFLIRILETRLLQCYLEVFSGKRLRWSTCMVRSSARS